MSPAKITYHALNVLICIVICVGIVATHAHTHKPDWPAAVCFIVVAFDAVASMSVLRKDKP